MNISRIGASQVYKVKPSSTQPKAAETTATPQKGDSITLSPTAEHLRVARAELERMPEVRADRVASFKKAIQNGEYKLNPQATAEGILKHALEARESGLPLDLGQDEG